MSKHRWRIAAVLVALAVVVVGKEYYRTATAADLRWILAPTAQLVSWITGGDFVYEAGPGWVDRDIGFIIAPVCAGVNFALAAFLALVLGALGAMATARDAALRLARAAVFAYAATVVVNTIRISIAVAMHRQNLSGMDREQLHTIEGIVVYFGGLCALYALARAIEARRQHAAAA